MSACPRARVPRGGQMSASPRAACREEAKCPRARERPDVRVPARGQMSACCARVAARSQMSARCARVAGERSRFAARGRSLWGYYTAAGQLISRGGFRYFFTYDFLLMELESLSLIHRSHEFWLQDWGVSAVRCVS